MAYKHGVYGEQVPFQGALPLSAVGTVPAYIGTAPIQQMNTTGAAGFDYTPYINRPILVSGYNAALTKIGYSDDWKSFTLSEAVSAHFLEGDAPVGPILLVNMADPSKKAAADTTTAVSLTGAAGQKVGYLDDPLAALEDIAVDGMTAGTDYALSWEDGLVKVEVHKADFDEASVSLTYRRMDVSDTVLTAAAFGKALDALDVAELTAGQIPNLIAAPGWSQKKDYHEKMVQKAVARLGEKWYVTLCSDLPADTQADTPEKAVTWKEKNGYDSKWDRVCWPMQETAGGNRYHLSTLAVVDMQNVDTGADGVPYISPSNEIISSDTACLADGTPLFLSEPLANSLNERGITTVNVIRGSLRLWGPHMSNYDYRKQDDIDPENRLDTGIRMPVYLMNYLQRNFIDNVDNPMSRRDKDSILASAQQWLNALVNQGALLYGLIEFREDENSTTDMVSGDFVFNVKQTNTPNAKSLTFKVEYVTTGLTALTGGESA